MADAAIPTPPAVKTVVYKPKNPSGLAQALVVSLYVDLGVNLLNFVADTLAFASEAYPQANDSTIIMFQGLSGVLQALVFLVCGFLCLKWIYRVSLNAHSMASDMTITPAWGVGWFFVPFACLWKPYQGVRETWQVSSAGGHGWQAQPVPLLLRWWWGLWIVANIFGNIALRLQLGEASFGATMIANGCSLAQEIANVPLDVLFILLVRRLTALQLGALSGHVFD